jgi:hypothetical protein
MSTDQLETGGYEPMTSYENSHANHLTRIIFIHGLNSYFTGTGEWKEADQVLSIHPIESPFKLPALTQTYAFAHAGNLLENVGNIAKGAKALVEAIHSGRK